MSEQYKTRQTLIQRLKERHDERSWEEFLRIYRPYIRTIIRKMNVSEHDADDIVQQVMVKVWNGISEVEADPNKRFRTWLSRVTKNCVKNYIRTRVRELERQGKALHEEAHAYLNAIRLPEIEQIAEREWGIHVCNLAIERIEGQFTGKAVEVFRLSLKGLDISQVAAKTGLQENSVYRLRNRVKKCVAREIEVLREELE